MNVSLLLTLLSISFIDPSNKNMCKNTDCNLLYMPTTANLLNCSCNETMQMFVYPRGYDRVYVNYSMTYPIEHDFYQNNTFVGSCPKDVMCVKRINLDPTKELTTIIREEYFRDEKTVLFSNDNYDLVFNTV